MNCTICGKPIVLVPSAKERAAKYGGMKASFEQLFTAHADCLVAKRSAVSVELIRQLNKGERHG